MNPSTLSPSAIAALLVSVAVGFLVTAYQTGKVLGFVTVPKPWLPWVGLAGTFLQGFVTSIGSQDWSGATVLSAVLQGLLSVAGVGLGAGVHFATTAHKSSRGVAASAAKKPPTLPPAGNVVAAAAAALPSETIPAPPVAPLAAYRIAAARERRTWKRLLASTVSILGFLFVTSDCQVPPQTQAEILAAERLGACIEQVYATDSQKAPPVTPLQIGIDEATICSADVIDIVNAFGPTPLAGRAAVVAAVQANPDAIHGAFLTARGAKK
jgi:hypothetical protein